jgi:hypothetical protein
MIDYKSIALSLSQVNTALLVEEQGYAYSPDSGIALASGRHHVSITTDFTPSEVYVSLAEDGVQVCGGSSASTVATTLTATGFLVDVNVSSSSAVLKWIACKS